MTRPPTMWTRRPVAMVDNQQLIAGLYRSGWTRGSLHDHWPRPPRKPMRYSVALAVVLVGCAIGWVVVP